MPPGLNFDASISAIVGVSIEVPGTYQIALSASNGTEVTNATLFLTIQPPSSGPTIISGTSAKGRTGDPFAFQVITIGATSAARLSASNLPPGLNVDPVSGLISGTATSDGSFGVTLTVTDGPLSAVATLQLTFTSDPAVPVITSPSSATLFSGQLFNYQIIAPSSADPGTNPTSYALQGILPPGLRFDPVKGTISGTYQGGF